MGRLRDGRARLRLHVAAVLLLPLAALLAANLRIASGVPVLTLSAAVVVAYLLSIGPRGFVVVWWGLAAEAVIARGVPLDLDVLAIAAVQAGVAVALVRLLEARFAHYGPVRRPIVMVEFAGIAGALLPLGLAAVAVGADTVLGTRLHSGPLLQDAAAHGLGVVAVTPGLRMVIKGQFRELDRRRLPNALGAAALSTVAVVVTVLLIGGDSIETAHVLAVPLLVLALMIGTVGYALAAGLTTIASIVPLAASGAMDTMDVATDAMLAWWIVGVLGLLLATDGDRRRAIATEYRSFFMRSATPAVSINASDECVLRANDAFAALIGEEVEDLEGVRLDDLLPDVDELHARLRQVRLGEVDEVLVEFALAQRDGGDRWVRCNAVRVELEGPQHDVVQVQFVDLTAERSRADSLERTNESLEQFGRRVTHDLKQPVSAVAAYASTLLEHGERMEDGMVRTMHERLAAAARRAVQQLDDTFAAAAARDPGPVDVRLHELVADVVGVVDLALNERGATVSTNLMRGHVHSEPAHIRQILLNLLTNSLKYRRPGHAPRITVSSRVRGAGVELTVTDNGAGIPADDLENVFTRGVRLAPGQADGRGDGLADSRELAASLGGTLRAEPWPDGARFVLWLPDPAAADAQTPTRVLVVAAGGETPAVLERRLGHRSSLRLVGAVTTVGDAVAAARDTRPDVILLDRALVDEHGMPGVVEIARAHRDARLVLLVRERTSDEQAVARSTGAVRAVDLAMDDEALAGGLASSPV